MAGAWQSGLFGCFDDVKVCLVSCFCPFCQLATQKATVEDHPCGIMDLLTVCLCTCCCGIVVRGKVREKYQISGNLVGDIVGACFCPCALAQQTRELQSRGAKPSGMCMEN